MVRKGDDRIHRFKNDRFKVTGPRATKAACARIFGERRLSGSISTGRVIEWHTRWTENARTLYHAN